MPSIQARLIRPLLGFTRNMIRTPLPKMRRQMKRFDRIMWIPRDIDILPTLAGTVPAEWTKAKRGTQDSGVLFYMHGGGFVIGSPRSHRLMVAHLVRLSGIPALSIDYRLAPEYPFPAALEDALEAYRWLLKSGISPGQIVFGGDSAGGNLVLAALLALRDAGEPLPAGALCISAVTDLTGNMKAQRSPGWRDPLLPPEISTWLDDYTAGADRTQPLLSPLWGDLHGLPPLLLQVGTEEILHEDSVQFAEKACQAGVSAELQVYEGMWHVFQIGGDYIPESRRALGEAASFIRRRLIQITP